MLNKLKKYLEENLIIEKSKSNFLGSTKYRQVKNKDFSVCDSEQIFNAATIDKSKIESFVKQKNDYNNFQTMLFKLIDERNLKDSDVYNKVHIDRRLFSKIRNDNTYHPSKETIILLGLALKLNESEIINLLDSASYSLPKNNYYDLIIRFCFINKIYEIIKVNELLEAYKCKLFNY